MGSITQYESVSQRGSADCVDDIVSPGSLVDVLSVVAGVPGVDAKWLEKVMSRWSGAYHAYLRALEKRGSVVGSSAGSLASRGVASVVESVSSCSTADTRCSSTVRYTPALDGYCYLVAIRPEFRQVVGLDLGPRPTVERFLALDAVSVVDKSQLDSMRVVVRDAVCHLRVAGSGLKFSSVLAAVSRGVKVESVRGFSLGVIARMWPLLGDVEECQRVLPEFVLGSSKVSSVTALVELDKPEYGKNNVAQESKGFCYLEFIREEYRSDCVAQLGPWPVVTDLISVPYQWLDLSACSLSIATTRGNVVVVDKFGPNGMSFMDLRDKWSRRDERLSSTGVPVVGGDYVFGLQGQTTDEGLIGASGFCYLRLVVGSWRERVARRLGPYPKLGQLFSLPDECMLPLNQVEGFYLSVSRRGIIHLGASGRFSYVASMKELLDASAMKLMPGMYGIRFKGIAVESSISIVDETLSSLNTRVGAGSAVDVMKVWLAELTEESVDAFADDNVRLLVKTAALHSAEDKRRLKMMEAVGDAAITAVVALKCSAERRTPQEYQEARSAVTSNATLSSVYSERVPEGLVTYPAGVNLSRGNVGAYVIEAVLGVVFDAFDDEKVAFVCRKLGVFDKFQWS